MGYIYTQSDHNEDLTFGPHDGESISQSLIFSRSFQLNSAVIRFGHVTLSPEDDLKFRCEVRRAKSSDKLLNLDDSPVMVSSWIRDENLLSDAYNTFALDRTVVGSGTYYFSIVTNVRIRYPIYLSLQVGGSFRGKFIKIIDETGIYRSDWSLAIKIDGVWGNAPPPITVHETNTYTETTIRDES